MTSSCSIRCDTSTETFQLIFVVSVAKIFSSSLFVTADGSRVDLASFTLSFVKGAMSFLEDGLRLDNPEVSRVLTVTSMKRFS